MCIMQSLLFMSLLYCPTAFSIKFDIISFGLLPTVRAENSLFDIKLDSCSNSDQTRCTRLQRTNWGGCDVYVNAPLEGNHTALELCFPLMSISNAFIKGYVRKSISH